MDRSSPKKHSPAKQGEYHKHSIFEDREREVNEMDRVMLDYLDIEGLLKLYKRNPELFTQYHLDKIANRFKLPHVSTFNELVYNYDTKYATIRSLYRDDLNVREVIKRAAKQGNIEVVVVGLKISPKLQTTKFYNVLLGAAAESGNRDLILLLQDLGANKIGAIFLGASKGGHLELVKENVPPLDKNHKVSGILFAVKYATKYSHLDVLEYLTSLLDIDDRATYLNKAMYEAGVSGNQEIIDYLLNKGAWSYKKLVDGAASRGHLDIVKKYYNKKGADSQTAFFEAVTSNHLDVAEFIASKTKIDQETINDSLQVVNYKAIETIRYLLKLGATNYNRVVKLAANGGYMDLLRRYYDSPGVSLDEAFKYFSNNLESLKFLIEEVGYVPTKSLLKIVIEGVTDPRVEEYLLAIEPIPNAGNDNSSETDTDTESESD